MSRSTQYIGLNDYAKNFTKNAIYSKPYLMKKGMFGEDIYGNTYKFKNKYGHMDFYREIVQDVPWSSGPMIFTCLRIEKTIRENMPDIDWLKDGKRLVLFQWMLDPSLSEEHLEYDEKTGRYWV